VKNLQLITLNFLVLSNCGYPMDQKKDNAHPWTIAWNKNKIFIGSANTCISWDVETGDQNTLCHNPTHHIIIHSQKPLMALSNSKVLQIYCTNTEKKLWSKETITDNISAPFFCRQNTIGIFNDNMLVVYDYLTDASSSYKIPIPSRPVISYCPQMDELAYVQGCSKILIFHPDLPMLEKDCQKNEKPRAVLSCEYSVNGALLAANTMGSCHIYDLRHPHKFFHLDNFYIYLIKSMRFHPNRPILAILTTIFDPHDIFQHFKTVVQYWNPIRKKLISQTTALGAGRPLSLTTSNTRQLAFSPEGNEIAVMIKDTCKILDVPFNNALLIYFVLKRTCLHYDIIAAILRTISILKKDFFELSYT
jgi:hypothetical protein